MTRFITGMTRAEMIAWAMKSVEEDREECAKKLQEWSAKLAERDPLYAFEWGGAAVKNAATIKVYDWALDWLRAAVDDAGKGEIITDQHVQEIIDAAESEASSRMSSSFRTSTSEMHNLSARALAEAWHDLWNRRRYGGGLRSLFNRIADCPAEGRAS